MQFCVLFAIFCALCTSINSQTTDRSVIIIGAGISGYSTARRLMENGFTDITILERENRIGGRIYSIPFANGMVDLGAQWIHGQTGNSLYQLVSPNFAFGSTPMGIHYPIFVQSTGTTPTQAPLRTLYSTGFRVLDDVYAIRMPTGNIGGLFNPRFDAATATATAANRDLIREEIHKDVNGKFGSPSWFDISARLNWMQSETGGDQYVTWRTSGFKTIFDFITRRRPNPAQLLNIDALVRFNKRVTNISYNTNLPNGRTTVRCADGTSYTARHVVVTTSVGVLRKYHQSMFTPALPTAKVRAINNILMGNVGKFFMEFDRQWWGTPGVPFLQYSFMWSETHKQLAISSGRGYLLDVVAIYAVDGFPNLLQVFLAGTRTLEFENASTDKVLNDIYWMLEMFLPNLRPIPRPRNFAKTQWLTHDSFLGSYTYPSVTQERNSGRNADLASTIRASNGMPQVLFAGEATNSDYPAMAHGAFDSGVRVANEIVAFHR